MLRASDLIILNNSTGLVFSCHLIFDARSHRSGPEISLCSQAIFGTDVDALSWDYGMTDGGRVHRIGLYGWRAAISPMRKKLPAMVGVVIAGRDDELRREEFRALERAGMASFTPVNDELSRMHDAFPDTVGMTDEQINALPDLVRNFRCGTSFESGDPYCGRDKYNMAMCANRNGRAGWHPGV